MPTKCLWSSASLFCFQTTYIHRHPHTALSFHMGVKNAPKPNDHKKTLLECHRYPPLRLSHPFSCQIPAHLPHNFLKNTLAIISFSAVALPTTFPNEPRRSLGTVMAMTSQSVATLGLFWHGPHEGQVLTNVVETTSLSLKKQSETGKTEIKCAYF